MRIAQICKYANTTVQGVDLFEEVARAFPDHQFDFYVLHGDSNHAENRLNCNMVHCHFTKKQLKRVRFSVLIELLTKLRRASLDVVITHRVTPTILIALMQLFLNIPRKIAVIHGIGQFRKPRRKLFLRLWLRSWTIVAVSEAVAEDLVRSGFSSKQVKVIRNAVNEELVQNNILSREEARKALGIPSHVGRLAGTIGRLHRVKGHRYLVHALAKEPAALPVAIIGGGSEEAALKAQIKQQALQNRLFLCGPFKNAYRYLSAFDVFIMPSVSEGLPISILEAISAGVPAFGTSVGGIPEILPNPEWTLPPQDSQALAKRLLTLTTCTESDLRTIAKAQHQVMEDKFGIEQYHQAFRELALG
ncbi:Glycosyl transferase, putative, gt4D [Alloalcanivorax dieselolei B5]|uniref:Glycosyl transferase, putative, gt4D n=1 Tax=Alcanivorax dieselolei (strain DSM 16502 / CGMCC 1.3690 / MCCC 1A00001 / B-5) TaxID=930169 RepID=K0CBS3_ALCDB|nr:glycosyltransferase [Alloalcanivorax dieselolei]AFT68936.1 Glycosyl transferase, putative, gt4D [Alloalcanivorax dieselolei B5]GGJ81386.1 hypothetical protein GCM10007426_07880 [Alloalcanivorax dieselolei]